MSSIIKVEKPDHLVINVMDVDVSLRFYTEILGLETARLEEYREGKAGFPSVKIGEQLIDIFPPKLHKSEGHAPDKEQRLNHFCLRISNAVSMEEVRNFLESHNIAIEGEAKNNWGAWGYGTSLYIRDPDGNTVELKQYPD